MDRVMLPASMMAALRRADQSIEGMGLGANHPLRHAIQHCQSLPGAISLSPLPHEVPEPQVFRVRRDEKGNVGEDTKCPICLGEFAEDEKTVIKTKCGHTFHADCLHSWKLTQSDAAMRSGEPIRITCPSCRTEL